jgi:hypothetical protein
MTNGAVDQVNRHPFDGKSAMVPFLLGTIVGGVAGAVVGTLLCHQTTGLATAVLDVIDRRLTHDDRDRLRFDLLLQ